MTPADPPAVHPPPDTVAPLLRGLCDQIDHDLSHLAWLLAGKPDALPPGTIQRLLNLNDSIHEIRRQIKD